MVYRYEKSSVTSLNWIPWVKSTFSTCVTPPNKKFFLKILSNFMSKLPSEEDVLRKIWCNFLVRQFFWLLQFFWLWHFFFFAVVISESVRPVPYFKCFEIASFYRKETDLNRPRFHDKGIQFFILFKNYSNYFGLLIQSKIISTYLCGPQTYKFSNPLRRAQQYSIHSK